MANQMMFIDRTPPVFDGDQTNYNSEMSSFMNYIVEIINYNASQGSNNNSEGGE